MSGVDPDKIQQREGANCITFKSEWMRRILAVDKCLRFPLKEKTEIKLY